MHVALVAFTPNFRGLHPTRPMRRAIFFVEERLIDTVRVPFHGERPVLQMRQQHRRNANVVVDYLTFRESGFRIEDLVEVRDRELFSLDDQLRLIAHLFSRYRTTTAARA